MLREEVIAQWKADLVDPTFPVFNLDFEHVVRNGKPEGDAGLFLAYRYSHTEDLAEYLGENRSHEIIADLTGIPLEDAYALINPTEVFARDSKVEPSRIKPRQFIRVLDEYLSSGVVDWSIVVSRETQA